MTRSNKPDFSRVSTLQIDADTTGQRLDNYLIARLKGVPRSRVYRIIRKGEVRVNKKRAQAQYKLQAGDVVRVPPIRVAATSPERPVSESLASVLDRSILFEDEGLLVLDKPAGLAVHGGSGLNLGLIEALRQTRGEPGLELVHRLDRETSGCLLVAKKRSALRQLHGDLREGRVEKTYLALAIGRWPARFGDVRAPLLKNHLQSGERMVVVSREGKAAHTRFKCLRQYAQGALVEASPITGRTHQIRVHARFAGCPLAGDSKYATDEANKAFRALGLRRLFLHASSLAFKPPAGGGRVSVTAPLPSDLENVLEKLSN